MDIRFRAEKTADAVQQFEHLGAHLRKMPFIAAVNDLAVPNDDELRSRRTEINADIETLLCIQFQRKIVFDHGFPSLSM